MMRENLISNEPDITPVLMPLVHAMAKPGLSWSDRQEIAAAIHQCNLHWQSMADEANHINSGGACLGAKQALDGVLGQGGRP